MEHLPGVGDDHDEHLAVGHGDEGDAPDPGGSGGRPHDDRSVRRQAREHRGGAAQQLDQLVLRAGERAPDVAQLATGDHRPRVRDLVHVRAVAVVGRDAPRRDVRLVDEPVLLERRQVVAHGGRAAGQAVAFDERSG